MQPLKDKNNYYYYEYSIATVSVRKSLVFQIKGLNVQEMACSMCSDLDQDNLFTIESDKKEEEEEDLISITCYIFISIHF